MTEIGLNGSDRIKSVAMLKHVIDQCFRDISPSCMVCTDPDCLGYIWVLPEEEGVFLDIGARTVQINGSQGPIFIDNYPRSADGNLIIDPKQTRCPYRDNNGRCTVHAARPLACHLYPLGIQTHPTEGYVWALHRDCHYVRAKEREGNIGELLDELYGIIDRLDPSVSAQIYEVYDKVEAISGRDGESTYYILLPLTRSGTVKKNSLAKGSYKTHP